MSRRRLEVSPRRLPLAVRPAQAAVPLSMATVRTPQAAPVGLVAYFGGVFVLPVAPCIEA